MSGSHPLAQVLAGIERKPEAQQEAISEAVAATWERIRDFQHPEDSVRYARTVARYRAIPKGRAIGSLPAMLAQQAEDFRGIRKDRTAQARKRLADCTRSIRKAYGNAVALPWVLVRIEGKATREVAPRFGVSHQTICNRIRKAEEHLRACIA